MVLYITHCIHNIFYYYMLTQDRIPPTIHAPISISTGIKNC